ncbi:MAG: arylsulfatase [Verrucomicrobiota bacterium]|nr:arylsulfatase [Verrucomicrobiota bacterium]
MTRRQFIRSTFAAGTALGLAGLGTTGCLAKRRRPNLILIVADDLGWGDLSCFGQQKFKTPHLDRMAAEGIRCTQFYSCAPVCAPARCGLLTGLHSGHAPIRTNVELEPEGQMPLPEGTWTFPRALADAGYATGCFGKWGLGTMENEGSPLRHGFGRFYGYLCQRQAHYHYPEALWDNEHRIALPENTANARQTYAPDLIAEQAIRFAEVNASRPYFLYFAPTLPHAELAAPAPAMAPFAGKYPETPFDGRTYSAQATPRAAYAAMVTRLDAHIGALLGTLRSTGQAEDTVVLFTSDNGPSPEGGSDPSFFNSSGPYRGGKRTLYEGALRVPLLAWAPGRIRPDQEIADPMAAWDIAATLLDFARATQPLHGTVDSRSFARSLINRATADLPRETLYWEYPDGNGAQALRDNQWKLIIPDLRQQPPAPELYNLETDLAEATNLADKEPSRLARMLSQMQNHHRPNKSFPLPAEV